MQRKKKEHIPIQWPIEIQHFPHVVLLLQLGLVFNSLKKFCREDFDFAKKFSRVLGQCQSAFFWRSE